MKTSSTMNVSILNWCGYYYKTTSYRKRTTLPRLKPSLRVPL